MTTVTNSTKNVFLSTQNRYFVAGWCDGEQSADIIMREDSPEYQDYLSGYAAAKDNEYSMGDQGC